MISDPLALFDTFADALRRGDWRAAATLCDPASLASFKRQLLEQFEPAHARRELTVEQYMRHEPDMPREVAEYQVAQINRRRDPAEHLQFELCGISSIAEVRELSPRDVFTAWLKARSPQHRIEQLVAQGKIPEEAAAEILNRPAPEFHYVVLGAVPDGENLMHVLFRHESSLAEAAIAWLEQLSAEEQALVRDLSGREHPQVTTCRRQPDGGWGMLAGYSLPGVDGFGYSLGFNEPESSARERSD